MLDNLSAINGLAVDSPRAYRKLSPPALPVSGGLNARGDLPSSISRGQILPVVRIELSPMRIQAGLEVVQKRAQVHAGVPVGREVVDSAFRQDSLKTKSFLDTEAALCKLPALTLPGY